MRLDTWQTDFMESLNMDRHQEYSNSLKVVRVGVSIIYSGFIIGCKKVFPSGVKFSSNPVQPLQRYCALQIHSVGKIRMKTLNNPMWPTPTNKTYYLFVSILSQVCKTEHTSGAMYSAVPPSLSRRFSSIVTAQPKSINFISNFSLKQYIYFVSCST